MANDSIDAATLDAMTMDELAELADDVRETQKAKRAEARERKTALKEELAGLRERRSRRTPGAAEPEAAEKPAKKKKKKNRG